MSYNFQHHRSNGYYTLPGVNRPINPRDPLGLWDVYAEDRRSQTEEKEEEKKKKIQQRQDEQTNEKTKPSYADTVKKNTSPAVQQSSKLKVVGKTTGEKIVINKPFKVSCKRAREQSSPNENITRPHKKLRLQELAKLDKDLVSVEQKDSNKNIIKSFQNYRLKKRHAKTSPAAPTYANVLKSGKRKEIKKMQAQVADELFEF